MPLNKLRQILAGEEKEVQVPTAGKILEEGQ